LGQPRALEGAGPSMVDRPPDKTETHLVRSALTAESTVEHSNQVIALLTKAYECFKKEKSTRMILHIAYQIGLEYYHSGHFELAKQ
jgi:ribulose bisphosphate carboxylase small subunit